MENFNTLFESTKLLRANIWKAVEGLSIEQLHKIPTGHNNNIIWHIGHVVATQQILCYKLAGAAMLFPDTFIDAFKKGSNPKDWAEFADIEIIKAYDKKATEVFKENYEAGELNNFKEYPTSSGLVLKTVEDAILYNYGHENLHYGCILEIKKHV